MQSDALVCVDEPRRSRALRFANALTQAGDPYRMERIRKAGKSPGVCRIDQLRRPSAITCCCVRSLKTVLLNGGGPVVRPMSASHMATVVVGFRRQL